MQSHETPRSDIEQKIDEQQIIKFEAEMAAFQEDLKKWVIPANNEHKEEPVLFSRQWNEFAAFLKLHDIGVPEISAAASAFKNLYETFAMAPHSNVKERFDRMQQAQQQMQEIVWNHCIQDADKVKPDIAKLKPDTLQTDSAPSISTLNLTGDPNLNPTYAKVLSQFKEKTVSLSLFSEIFTKTIVEADANIIDDNKYLHRFPREHSRAAVAFQIEQVGDAIQNYLHSLKEREKEKTTPTKKSPSPRTGTPEKTESTQSTVGILDKIKSHLKHEVPEISPIILAAWQQTLDSCYNQLTQKELPQARRALQQLCESIGHNINAIPTAEHTPISAVRAVLASQAAIVLLASRAHPATESLVHETGRNHSPTHKESQKTLDSLQQFQSSLSHPPKRDKQSHVGEEKRSLPPSRRRPAISKPGAISTTNSSPNTPTKMSSPNGSSGGSGGTKIAPGNVRSATPTGTSTDNKKNRHAATIAQPSTPTLPTISERQKQRQSQSRSMPRNRSTGDLSSAISSAMNFTAPTGDGSDSDEDTNTKHKSFRKHK